MANTSKLFNAKLKISQLKEKYSKAAPLAKTSLSPVNSIGNPTSPEISVGNESEPNLGSHLNPTIAIKETDKQQINENKDETPRRDNNYILQIQNHMFSENMDIKLPHTPSTSSYSSPSKSVSKISQSTIQSDLSNQFQNLYFVSSSSSDSTLEYNSLKEPEGPVLHNSDRPTLPQRPEKGNHKNKKYDDVSIQSSIHTEISSNISMAEEISEINQNITNHDNISSNGNNSSNHEELNYDTNVESETLDTNIKEFNLKSNSATFTEDRAVIKPPVEKVKLKKQDSQITEEFNINQNTKVLSIDITDNRLANNNKYFLYPYRNDSTRTSSSLSSDDHIKISKRSKSLKRVIKNKSNIDKPSENVIPVYVCDNLGNKIPNKQGKRIKHNVNIKFSRTRPTLKSCKLIQNKEEFECYQNGDSISRINIIQGTVWDGYETGNSCDQVIRQLLRSQILLTRHFIETHHQMYLHCCHAVQLLSDQHNSKNEHITGK